MTFGPRPVHEAHRTQLARPSKLNLRTQTCEAWVSLVYIHRRCWTTSRPNPAPRRLGKGPGRGPLDLCRVQSRYIDFVRSLVHGTPGMTDFSCADVWGPGFLVGLKRISILRLGTLSPGWSRGRVRIAMFLRRSVVLGPDPEGGEANVF